MKSKQFHITLKEISYIQINEGAKKHGMTAAGYVIWASQLAEAVSDAGLGNIALELVKRTSLAERYFFIEHAGGQVELVPASELDPNGRYEFFLAGKWQVATRDHVAAGARLKSKTPNYVTRPEDDEPNYYQRYELDR